MQQAVRVGRERWHVRIEEAYEHAGAVLKYAGRYIRRGPLSERRILAYDGKSVRIAYAHLEKHEHEAFTLPASEFVRRLLNHAPERGTHCVRVYGLYHSACRKKLNQVRSRLSQPPYEPEAERPAMPTTVKTPKNAPLPRPCTAHSRPRNRTKPPVFPPVPTGIDVCTTNAGLD